MVSAIYRINLSNVKPGEFEMEIGENQPQPAALEETGLLDFLGVVTGKQCFKVYHCCRILLTASCLNPLNWWIDCVIALNVTEHT